MKAFKERYKMHFTDRDFIFSVLAGLFLLLGSFVVNFYAGTYATRNASHSVEDIVLSNIPVFHVDDIFIYGPLILWFFVGLICINQPKGIPFVLKSVALFMLIRSVFITLTHIGPFPDQITIATPESWINKFTFGGDLFFSAHTGLPFLMALIYHKNRWWFWTFSLGAVFFGVIVLMGHLHYSIDVLSAFFITYTIFHISKFVFKKDVVIFEAESNRVN